MARLNTTDFLAAQGSAVQRWRQAHPDFTSGHDIRSSDNALLVQIYGGLEHARRNDWLNAGRRLIDKTYIHMLWVSHGLGNLRFAKPEDTAAALDPFLRETLADIDLNNLLRPKHAIATELLEQAAAELFGSLHSEIAASRLLFMLCPQLPIYPYSRGHLQALEGLGYKQDMDGYRGYALMCEQAKQDYQRQLDGLALPQIHYGTEQEQQWIEALFKSSDWWQRRLFDQALRHWLGAENTALFGCTADGGLL